MNADSQQFLQAALNLPDEDRAEIAAILIRSLESPQEPGLDEAWSAEIKRRVEASDRGEVTHLAWDQVIREFRSSADE